MPATPHPLTLPAPAKLNRMLHIVGRRPDGYHELQTLFQLLDLCDTLTFTLRQDRHIELTTPLAGVTHDDNLIVRAARLLQQESGHHMGVSITIDKRLPMGGGLGVAAPMPPPCWWVSISCGSWVWIARPWPRWA